MYEYKKLRWTNERLNEELIKWLEEYMEKFPFRVRDKKETEYYRKIFNHPNAHKKYGLERLLSWRGYIENNPPKTPYFLAYLIDKIEPGEYQIEAGYRHYFPKDTVKQSQKTEFQQPAMEAIRKQRSEEEKEREKMDAQVEYWEKLQKSSPVEADEIRKKAIAQANQSLAALRQKFSAGYGMRPQDEKFVTGCILAILEKHPEHAKKMETA